MSLNGYSNTIQSLNGVNTITCDKLMVSGVNAVDKTVKNNTAHNEIHVYR